MASPSPVALIFGGGANIGKSVARAFASKGYRIAMVARSLKEEDSTADELLIKGDLAAPETVPAVFEKVRARFGPPSVVVYNASAATFGDKHDPLAIPLEGFQRNLAINLGSPFAAAQLAVRAFAELPPAAARTFIYTGNCTNLIPIAALLDSGIGKSGSAHMIQVAAEAYKDKGFKFYYADQRQPDGTPMYRHVNGDAHGRYYTELAEGNTQGPWLQTFVGGVGYKTF